MKRIVLASAIGLMSLSAFGQDATIDKATVDQLKKDKEKSDAGVSDPKNAAKAAFWMERAKIYEDIANKNTASQLDSTSAKTALEAYKKVVELDKTKKGEPGKSAKEAQKALNGEEGTYLYNAFFRQGAEQYQVKNLSSALEMFKLAQQINPKDTTTALYGGITAQQLEKKEDAISQFEVYTKNGGKDPSVFYGLSQLYRADNKFDKATEALKMGLERSPGNKDLKAEVVNILLASGQEEKAIEELTALAQADPNNVQNVVNLAILYDNLNTKSSNRIKEINTKLGGGANKKAAVAKDIEAEKSRIEVYNGEVKRIGGLIKKQPKNADLKRQLADVNAKLAESKAAITKLEEDGKAAEAAAASGDNAALEKELAELKTKQAEAAKLAVENYQKALAIDGNNPDALYNLGVVYFNQAVIMKGEVDNMNMTEYQQRGKEVEGRVCGRFKKAKPYFEKALAAKPDMAEAKENLGTVNSVLEQFSSKGIACVEE